MIQEAIPEALTAEGIGVGVHDNARDNGEPETPLSKEEQILLDLREMCASLLESDPRAYGQFLKKVRQIIAPKLAGGGEPTGDWVKTIGTMKDSPTWDEVVAIIERGDE